MFPPFEDVRSATASVAEQASLLVRVVEMDAVCGGTGHVASRDWLRRLPKVPKLRLERTLECRPCAAPLDISGQALVARNDVGVA